MKADDNISRLADQIHRKKKNDLWGYHLVLGRHTDTHAAASDYRSLAELLRKAYFSTVLTANLEPFLEDALEQIGLRPPQYTIHHIGQDDDARVIKALDSPQPGIRIVKLHESSSGASSELITFSPEIQAALQRYLDRDSIIVHSLAAEPAFMQVLQPIVQTLTHDHRNLYYVVPLHIVQSGTDTISAIMQQRRHDAFLISEAYGEFTAFFRELAYLLRVAEERPKEFSFPIKPATPSRTVPLPVETPIPKKSKPPPTDDTHPPFKRGKAVADVLLVTATEVEVNAVLEQAPTQSKSERIDKRTYNDLGLIGGNRTFMVRATTTGPLEAASVTRDGIAALAPKAVIMVGVAFGCDEKKQKIGDILVAKQILDYDPQKIHGKEEQKIEYRGDIVSTSKRLQDRFNHAKLTIEADWPDVPSIHMGLICSGSVLSAHQNFRKQLRQLAPNAIGGEMEGGGLYHAIHDTNQSIDWILVKAICDWGDEDKDDSYQRLAAENAARFTLYVIAQEGFLDRRKKR